MRVMVAGAAGAIGTRLVPLLVAAGHTVTGLTRSASKTEALMRADAVAVAVDALDAATLRKAALDVRPIVHEMTAISGASDSHAFRSGVHRDQSPADGGPDNLLAAAREAQTRRFIAQSFCGWSYARTGGPVDGRGSLGPVSGARISQHARGDPSSRERGRGATAFDGLILRYGAFYGPRSGLFDGLMIDLLRRRRAPLIGEANGCCSCTSTTRLGRPPSLSKKARPVFTTSSTTTPLLFANGCPRSQG